ncbi:GntR family transcriptional regulator [Arenibacter sp. M-2]|uniref:HTH-type transcriptional repressor DasR n=2 Tax=Arenibacter TaxID=178469 RepID=A0A221UZE6_9FLAO|nr:MULTISPECIES: GntR family transcriptional regulator [Arenibacter]ASO06476.1 HTH-type transcriptional repressor DasR [Arenibacter algicola]MDL5512887.1 GntR family transcriptional regulator [Arenibacter sp. M-2]SHF85559.1 GntR family transcriptional regulator [Arenibacter palladensis]|tara:strand:- start:331 stop:1095 length:765 start_codon:yes stop_codon:yes gene_type:complete
MKNATPKYISISKELIQKIESGEYQPGDKIPSENELIEMYSVSNTTARKSLLEVELRGWANRIRGKGTYVLNRFEDKHITRVLGAFDAVKESFNTKLVQEGFKPKNVIIEKVVMDEGISTNINNKHYIMNGPILKIHRLRYADEILLKDETRYISMTLCPKINIRDFEGISLITAYEKEYNLKLTNVERTLGNTILTPNEEKNNFENEVPMAAFVLDGAVFCEPDQIVEIEHSYYRGDKYKFAVVAKPQLTLEK